jgi:hypothetical protein
MVTDKKVEELVLHFIGIEWFFVVILLIVILFPDWNIRHLEVGDDELGEWRVREEGDIASQKGVVVLFYFPNISPIEEHSSNLR